MPLPQVPARGPPTSKLALRCSAMMPNSPASGAAQAGSGGACMRGRGRRRWWRWEAAAARGAGPAICAASSHSPLPLPRLQQASRPSKGGPPLPILASTWPDARPRTELHAPRRALSRLARQILANGMPRGSRGDPLWLPQWTVKRVSAALSLNARTSTQHSTVTDREQPALQGLLGQQPASRRQSPFKPSPQRPPPAHLVQRSASRSWRQRPQTGALRGASTAAAARRSPAARSAALPDASLLPHPLAAAAPAAPRARWAAAG